MPRAGRVQGMSQTDDLDALSSRELHDLAVRRALHHLDVAFLWDLLRALPAGEAIAGHPDHAGADALHLSALIGDVIDADDTADLPLARRPNPSSPGRSSGGRPALANNSYGPSPVLFQR